MLSLKEICLAGRGDRIVEWHELQCPARDPRRHDRFESRNRIAMSREDDAGQGSPSLSAAACWARKCTKGGIWLSKRADHGEQVMLGTRVTLFCRIIEMSPN